MTLDIAGAGAQDTQAIPAPTSISSEEIGNRFVISVCDNIVTYFRITPAYAGKTSRQVFFWRLLKDHPRVCGKDPLRMLIVPTVLGSPPRMRERLDGAEREAHSTGITPAYAGKTLTDRQKANQW